MDSDKIQVLLSCLEEGSMMGAAEKLGYTPSGLTHMMDALERDLGAQIISRGRYGIRLTSVGEQLLPQLRQFVEQADGLRASARRLSKVDDGVIRVGSYNSIARNWLPRLFSDFSAANPDCTIELTTYRRSECRNALDSGAVNLLFACSNEKYDYNFRPMKKDSYLAVLPKGMYDISKGYFDIADFERYPFIMPSYGKDPDVIQALKAHSIVPRQVAATADNDVVLSMISAGLGISMMTNLVLQRSVLDADVLPVKPDIFRMLGLVYKPDEELTGAEKRFVEFVQSYSLE